MTHLKITEGFCSFGPSMSQSLNSPMAQSVPSLSTDTRHVTKHRMRKISIHLMNEILKMQQKNTNIEDDSPIKVYCRFKPSPNPTFKYDFNMVDDGNIQYTFDSILAENIAQIDVYNKVAKTHIEDFIEGINSTIFAYGQTNSGKTHTMFGDMKNPQQYGLIPRALNQIFAYTRDQPQKHQITCSMLEIYKEKLKDLFACDKSELKIKENFEGTYVEGLMEIAVDNQEQLIDLINFGHSLRRVGQTFHNDYSSRSHTILMLYHSSVNKYGINVKSRLCLIDLAGSEKVSKTGATGETLEEAKKINLSLSCLGNVIHSLTSGSDHIPYRDSKLTRILKDALSGYCRTSIIITCSLDKQDKAETISTMKFAIRAKKIKNKLRIEQEQTDPYQTIQKLKKELEETKRELDYYRKKDLQQQWQEEQVPEEIHQVLKPLKILECNVNRMVKLKK